MILERLYHAVPSAVIRLLSAPLPNRVGIYNGVAVQDVPFFSPSDHTPHKKATLWAATKAALSPNASVAFVGGGKGIVPVKTAQRGHEVTVIEGARELVCQLEQTAGLNAIDLDVVHGVVGDGANVWGDDTDARTVQPSALDADVVVLDCEGAETSILPLPNVGTVVVETHPFHGVTETEVRAALSGTVVDTRRNWNGGKVVVRE